MRKTKIICTIGPASNNEPMLEKLMLAGMNVARFNFSHGSHEEQKGKFDRVVKVRQKLGLPVATLLDTKGPEIRLCDFEKGKVELKAGQTFTLTTREVMGTEDMVSITYKNLKNDVSVGSRILIDDGLIEMFVDEKGEIDVYGIIENIGDSLNEPFKIDLRQYSPLLPNRTLLITKEDLNELFANLTNG